MTMSKMCNDNSVDMQELSGWLSAAGEQSFPYIREDDKAEKHTENQDARFAMDLFPEVIEGNAMYQS